MRVLMTITRRHVLSMLCAVPAGAAAHHGFGGTYDFDAPLLADGRVSAAHYGHPHGRITIEVASGAVADLAGLQAIEQAEGRATLSIVKALPAGSYRVLLDPPTTSALASHPQALRVGDRARVIAYRRVSSDVERGELRALHVVLRNGELMAGQPRSYHRGAQR
jgi:hypothetical protein